jgi:hypothetical protein
MRSIAGPARSHAARPLLIRGSDIAWIALAVALLLLLAAMTGCASTATSKASSADDGESEGARGRGYSSDDPIGVRDLGWSRDALNESYYLNLLRGPEGQQVHYRLIGPCCAFDVDGKPTPHGELHRYRVQYRGMGDYVILYLDPKGQDELRPPEGLVLTD